MMVIVPDSELFGAYFVCGRKSVVEELHHVLIRPTRYAVSYVLPSMSSMLPQTPLSLGVSDSVPSVAVLASFEDVAYTAQLRLTTNKLKELFNATEQPNERMHLAHWLWTRYVAISPDTTLFWAQQEYKYASITNSLSGAAYSFLGTALSQYNSGRTEQAFESVFQALKLGEESGNKRVQGTCLYFIGTFYGAQNDQERQASYFLRGLALLKEVNARRNIADAMRALGNLALKQAQYEEALDYYRQSQQIYQDLEDRPNAAFAMTLQGDVFQRQNNFAEALNYYNGALAISSRGRSAIAIYRRIGLAFAAMKQFDSATYYINRSIEAAQKANFKREIQETLKAFSELYSQQGNFAKALDYYKRYAELRDSLFTAESRSNILALETKLKNDRLENELRTQKVIRNGIIVGAVLLVVVMLVLAREYRRKRRLAGELQQKNEEITQQQAALQAKNFELEAARQESDKLLLNVLPAPIATRLKSGEQTIADSFTDVTVLFSDLVGFTQISATMPAEQTVRLLNTVFSAFDALAQKYDVEKIKTIGDAYMVVGGLPKPSKDHAVRVALFALEMLHVLQRASADLEKEGYVFGKFRNPLQIRIGIHSGPVVAGVIGVSKFAYDLWGDTVNTASRMEFHGIEGQIHCSESTYLHLKHKFRFRDRGMIDIKGKGLMHTYFLVEAVDKRLLSEPPIVSSVAASVEASVAASAAPMQEHRRRQ
jgi:class 3 adenylate cyclase